MVNGTRSDLLLPMLEEEGVHLTGRRGLLTFKRRSGVLQRDTRTNRNFTESVDEKRGYLVGVVDTLSDPKQRRGKDRRPLVVIR